MLIGDSIRMGYDRSVRKSLAGLCEVHFPEDAHSEPVHYYTSTGTRALIEQVLSVLYREELYVKTPVGI